MIFEVLNCIGRKKRIGTVSRYVWGTNSWLYRTVGPVLMRGLKGNSSAKTGEVYRISGKGMYQEIKFKVK